MIPASALDPTDSDPPYSPSSTLSDDHTSSVDHEVGPSRRRTAKSSKSRNYCIKPGTFKRSQTLQCSEDPDINQLFTTLISKIDGGRVFKCQCGKECHRPYDARRHAKMHMKRVKCGACSKILSGPLSLAEHRNEAHKDLLCKETIKEEEEEEIPPEPAPPAKRTRLSGGGGEASEPVKEVKKEPEEEEVEGRQDGIADNDAQLDSSKVAESIEAVATGSAGGNKMKKKQAAATGNKRRRRSEVEALEEGMGVERKKEKEESKKEEEKPVIGVVEAKEDEKQPATEAKQVKKEEVEEEEEIVELPLPPPPTVPAAVEMKPEATTERRSTRIQMRLAMEASAAEEARRAACSSSLAAAPPPFHAAARSCSSSSKTKRSKDTAPPDPALSSSSSDGLRSSDSRNSVTRRAFSALPPSLRQLHVLHEEKELREQQQRNLLQLQQQPDIIFEAAVGPRRGGAAGRFKRFAGTEADPLCLSSSRESLVKSEHSGRSGGNRAVDYHNPYHYPTPHLLSHHPLPPIDLNANLTTHGRRSMQAGSSSFADHPAQYYAGATPQLRYPPYGRDGSTPSPVQQQLLQQPRGRGAGDSVAAAAAARSSSSVTSIYSVPDSSPSPSPAPSAPLPSVSTLMSQHYARAFVVGPRVHQPQMVVAAPSCRLYPAPLSFPLLSTIYNPAWARSRQTGADELHAASIHGHSNFILPIRMHRTETMIGRCLRALEETSMPLPPLQPLLPAPCDALAAGAAAAAGEKRSEDCDPLTDVLDRLPSLPSDALSFSFPSQSVFVVADAKSTMACEGARHDIVIKTEDRKWWEVRTFPSFSNLSCPITYRTPTSLKPAMLSYTVASNLRAHNRTKLAYVTSKKPVFSVHHEPPRSHHHQVVRLQQQQPLPHPQPPPSTSCTNPYPQSSFPPPAPSTSRSTTSATTRATPPPPLDRYPTVQKRLMSKTVRLEKQQFGSRGTTPEAVAKYLQHGARQNPRARATTVAVAPKRGAAAAAEQSDDGDEVDAMVKRIRTSFAEGQGLGGRGGRRGPRGGGRGGRVWMGDGSPPPVLQRQEGGGGEWEQREDHERRSLRLQPQIAVDQDGTTFTVL